MDGAFDSSLPPMLPADCNEPAGSADVGQGVHTYGCKNEKRGGDTCNGESIQPAHGLRNFEQENITSV